VSFRSTFTRCPKDGAELVWSADDPLIGAAIAERYVIEALVGEGAMGLVYRAHHARLSRLFAVKLMFGDVAIDPAMRMRFAQEADAASRLCHPNVVSVVDFGRTERGLLYLAMDYVDGETLATLIRREGPLAERRVIALARQMCRGLGHAHRAGLVHRDFKPANVAVATGDDGGELVRVLDFGLAISERDGDRAARLTEHGLVVGTPIYISPEQAKDHPVDHRADLFALGVVMYEMLAGMPPFEGSGAEIARANVQQKPPAMKERNPRVSVTPELEALVFRLLEKRAADRYQDAEEVIAALDELERRGAFGRGRGGEPQARGRSPVLWLSGRPTRRWRRTASAPPVPRAIDPSPAPYPLRRSAHGAAQAETWGPGRDAERTVGMAPRAEGRWRRLPRRRIALAAWLLLMGAGVTLSRGEDTPVQAGAREATAAMVEEEPAEVASSVRERAAAAALCSPAASGAMPPSAASVFGKMAAGSARPCHAHDAGRTGAAAGAEPSHARAAEHPPRRPRGHQAPRTERREARLP